MKTALIPSANPRSDGGNARVTIAAATENIIAPPSPWTARLASNQPKPGLRPLVSAPSVKTLNPITYSRFVLTRSPRRPKVINRAVITSV